MKIEVLDSLEPPRHEWTELCRRSAATPFQSPQWLIPWTRHLFGGGEIWIVAMRDGGKLVGIAPLFRWGAHERRVSFLGAGVSDYGGLVCAPGLERGCARE